MYNASIYAQRVLLATRLIAVLVAAGFRKATAPGTVEVVYERQVQNSPIVIRVYTSIQGEAIRPKGTDAIRVAHFENGVKLSKSKKIVRRGKIENICERTIQRCRDAYREVNQGVVRSQRLHCPDCGADMKVSKKGKLYCSAICWKQQTQPAQTRTTSRQARFQRQPRRPLGSCSHCGAAMRRSQKGNLYCSAICWERNPRNRNRQQSQARTVSQRAQVVSQQAQVIAQSAQRTREHARNARGVLGTIQTTQTRTTSQNARLEDQRSRALQRALEAQQRSQQREEETQQPSTISQLADVAAQQNRTESGSGLGFLEMDTEPFEIATDNMDGLTYTGLTPDEIESIDGGFRELDI